MTCRRFPEHHAGSADILVRRSRQSFTKSIAILVLEMPTAAVVTASWRHLYQHEYLKMSAAVEFETMIDGEQIQGWTVKDGKSYRAYADFRGEQVSARGPIRSNAESKWREKANHKANE